MGVQYLVDYENVHETGLIGMDKLTAEDSVFIFHTSKNDRISLSRLDNVQAWVRVVMVPPGKQSLDMHLGSFLGYLIGKEGAETRFAIVSLDSDYRKIAEFWNDSFQSPDKVRCIPGINYPLVPAVSAAMSLSSAASPSSDEKVLPETPEARFAIRDFLIRTILQFGVKNLGNAPRMLVSEICARLRKLTAYVQERKRLGKQPMQFLIEECADTVWVRREWGQDWAILLAAQEDIHFRAEEADRTEPAVSECKVAVSVDAISEGVAPEGTIPVAVASEDTAQETAALAETAPAEAAAEEEVPDGLDFGDLSIDEEPVTADAPEEITAVTESPAEPDLLSVALECIHDAESSEVNTDGFIRASVLRDRLMMLPVFRASLKESGMKPIAFIQQRFEGSIRIRREKGIFWAADEKECEKKERDAVIAKRKQQFLEKACNNIRNRLSDAGIDQNVAEEIAGICMRFDSDGERRKTIHLMLCQRFGPRTGSKYYRQAVKYISA